MTRVGVVHNKFTTTGGAETVCMNTLEALQAEHSLSLFSFDQPDFDALNDFCGTDVDPVPVHRPERLGPLFNAAVSTANDLTSGRFGPHIQLKTAVLNKLVRERSAEFDLRVSTGNELAIPNPSVQYLHFPMFNRRSLDGELAATGVYNRWYDQLCSRLAGVGDASLAEATVLTNSEWTARRVEQIYETSARVLYPPVNVTEFSERPPEDRDRGFVTIGRVAPDKNQLATIDIVRQVRERGHDVDLYIIGPSAEHNRDYKKAVRTSAATLDFVTYEGELSREELVSLVCSHRYGIHGKPREHFGITVAELVAGGTLPFVPASGGQVELVNRQDDLLWSSVDDAVEKIDSVLSDPDREANLRAGLPDVSESLGHERFQAEMAAIVQEALPE